MLSNAPRLLLPLLLALALMAAGCGDDSQDVDSGTPPGLPDRSASYAGELTSVTAFEPVTEDCIDPADADPDGSVSDDDPPFCTDPETAPLGHVLLEASPGVQEGDKISLRVDPETPIFRSDGNSLTPVTFDDLTEGDLVDAWVDGPVAESYPMQATASALLVTG